MREIRPQLVQVIAHPCDIKTFRFSLREDIPFTPGQYLLLALPVGEKTVSKPFSLSNSPTEKGYIEFTKKMSDSDYSKALNSLAIGQECLIRLPMGSFIYEGEFPRVAFLCGGIGVTPIRSMVKYAVDMQLPVDMVVLYSSRNPECVVFKDDFALMQRAHRDLKVIYTLTRCDEGIEGCRTGEIDEEMIREEVPDYGDRVFYLCGPAPMVRALRTVLLDRMALPAERVKSEVITSNLGVD